MLTVTRLSDPVQIAATFSIMRQLRTHIVEAEYVPTILQQMERGYKLLGFFDADELVGLVGYRCRSNLAWGKYIYIDDLVIDVNHRRRGFGSEMLKTLDKLAREAACDAIHLDSRVEREDAHAFYISKGWRNSSLHYTKPLHEA